MQQHLVDKLQLLRWIRFSDVNNNKMDEELCARWKTGGQNGKFYILVKLFNFFILELLEQAEIHVDMNILMNTLLHFSQVSFAKARRTRTYFWLS